MSKIYHPTRLDHFPRNEGAKAIQKWLEDHNLPVATGKHASMDNADMVIRATGGKV